MTHFSKVFAPSDAFPEGRFALGGRVVARDAQGLVLADAFASVTVRGSGAFDVGDLVMCELVRDEATGAWVALSMARVGEDVRVARDGGESARLGTRARGLKLRERARLMGVVRDFFAARGFVEAETPAMVPCPGLDLHLDAFTVQEQPGADGLPDASSRYLITSPEYQLKRLMAGGIHRPFQIARCFRRGEVGARHNPEFTMLEWYRAFSSIDEIIEDTEQLVVALATAASGAPFFDLPRGRRLSLTPPFERLPIATAFARHGGLSEEQALALALSGNGDDEERFFRILAFEVEPALAEGPPVILCDYPVSQASLARRKPSDPRVAERFELMIGGVELCNGFGELVDPVEQRERLLRDRNARIDHGKPAYPIDERFLSALEEGLPPSSGNALGLDRLIALCLGAAEIGDVQAFPEGWL